MPRKQRNKPSNKSGSRSLSTQKPSDSGDSGFPPHLLCGRGSHHPSDTLETLVPNAVFVARHALSSKECRDWIKYGEEANRWETVSHPATKWIAHRECGRIQKNDWTMSHRLYERIQAVVQQVSGQLDIFDRASLLSKEAKGTTINASLLLPKYQPVSCNPNLRLYKYTRGQWFGRHVDGANEIDVGAGDAPPAAAAATAAQTEITVLFYLSACRGGATRFHAPSGRRGGRARHSERSGTACLPEEGAVLLHVHGERCLEHEAEPVLEGVKYVLRTDVVYGIV